MKEITDKIIIHNYSDLSDYEVLLYIAGIVKWGKVSKTSQGEQYCPVMIYKSGITISSGRKNNTYTFYVERRKNKDE